MQVVAATEAGLEVERDQAGAVRLPHSKGTELQLGQRVTPLEFFTHTKWNPQIGDFGVLPLVTATLVTSVIAMLVALPLGLSVAIYLSEYATQRARTLLKPILEVLVRDPNRGLRLLRIDLYDTRAARDLR